MNVRKFGLTYPPRGKPASFSVGDALKKLSEHPQN